MEEVHMCKQYMHAMLPAVAGSLDLVLHTAERMRVTVYYIHNIIVTPDRSCVALSTL